MVRFVRQKKLDPLAKIQCAERGMMADPPPFGLGKRSEQLQEARSLRHKTFDDLRWGQALPKVPFRVIFRAIT